MLLLSGVSVIRPIHIRQTLCHAILLAGLTSGGCDRQKAPDGQESAGQPKLSPSQAPGKPGSGAFRHQVIRSHAGKAATAASFTGPDDSAVTLAQFRGRPLLVNLWATWCAPCVVEMPTLDRLAAASGDKLTVIAVAQDLQGAAVVDPWFQKAGLTTLQPYLDPDNRLLDAANSALPTSILYNAKGQEIWRVVGAIDWQGAEAEALLAESSI